MKPDIAKMIKLEDLYVIKEIFLYESTKGSQNC